MAKLYRVTLYGVFIATAFALAGCMTLSDKPRPRPGCYASNTVKVPFNDSNSLGNHNRGSFMGERDGIVYTDCGGHIDIAHLRIAADNVYYLHNKISRQLNAGCADFTCKLNTDTSVFDVDINCPPNFSVLAPDKQQKIIDDVSLEAAQYIAWQMVTWHEVATWFGQKLFGVVPQFQSAFSWEDNYSNLLGVILAGKAIRHPDQNFNDDMTVLLKEELGKLGSRSADVAQYASEKMRDKWYTGYLDVHILKRNFDIGLDDGYVSPVLVPGMCVLAKPRSYPSPKLATAKQYGFTVKVAIKPRGSVARHCLDIIYPDGHNGPVIPSIHLPVIMKQIKKEAAEMGFITS